MPLIAETTTASGRSLAASAAMAAARTNCAPPPTEVPPKLVTRGLPFPSHSHSVQRLIQVVE
ncbi:MAG: hypothetical protein ACR2JR_01120, partial [Rubrobacteraceae bacterium]